MTICPHCGLSNSDSNKWCESCGCELIVDDNIEIGKPDSSTTKEQKITTSGFMGSMGQTHYVSGYESNEAGDVQKHISGLGLMGKMGCAVYETATTPEEENVPANRDPGKFFGSIGDTKYRLYNGTSEEQSEHVKSKLLGKVGSVEYRGAISETCNPRRVKTSSGLMGSVGDSIYVTNYEEERSVSCEREIIGAGIIGNMGGTHYRDVIKSGETTSPSPKPAKKMRRIAIAGAISAIISIIVISIIVLRPNSPDFSGAISQRIENEMVYISDPPLEYQYSNAILQSIRYTIVSHDRRNNTATVQFKYVNVMALADELGNSVRDQNEYYNYCIEAIREGTAPFATKTIQVRFEEREIKGIRQLCVIDSFELADILSGGTVSAYVSIMEGLA